MRNLTAILVAVLLAGCASTSLGPQQKVANLNQIAGTWEGPVYFKDGGSMSATLVVTPEGTFTYKSERGDTGSGSVRVENGAILGYAPSDPAKTIEWRLLGVGPEQTLVINASAKGRDGQPVLYETRYKKKLP